MCRKHIILLFLLMFSFFENARAQQFEYIDSSLFQEQPMVDSPEEEYNESQPDTGVYLHPVAISQDTIRRWKGLKQYAYIHNLDSLLKVAQKQAIRATQKMPSPNGNSFFSKLLNSSFLTYLLWTIAALFVGYILYQFFVHKGTFLRPGKTIGSVSELTEEEQLMSEDFPLLAARARSEGDYRLAIRFWFLHTLQQLSARSLIEFSAGKTNSRYVQEIPMANRTAFSALVRHYEYVWYGNSAPEKEQFDIVESRFEEFNKTI